MKLESHDKMTKKRHKLGKIGVTAALVAALFSSCEAHFPNDKFTWWIPDRSGKFNITYEHSEWSAWANYVYMDVDVKENGDEWYIAYITKNKKQYTISAKTIEELQSKLEYDLVITHSEYIKPTTQKNAKEKIISFADAYDMFLEDSEGEYIEINSIKIRLEEIKWELENLKGEKWDDIKLIRKRLQEEQKVLEKRLEDLNKPIEVPYNKKSDSTWN